MDEKKNKNNLEVTETAEEKVEKAGEQTEQEENFFKKTWNRVRKLFKKDEEVSKHYISAKESRRISKENLKITLEFEKKKRRKKQGALILLFLKTAIHAMWLSI
mgnify:CR=1 FL=1